MIGSNAAAGTALPLPLPTVHGVLVDTLRGQSVRPMLIVLLLQKAAMNYVILVVSVTLDFVIKAGVVEITPVSLIMIAFVIQPQLLIIKSVRDHLIITVRE